MKILMNCHAMPTEKEGSGGAGKYVQALIPYLAQKSELHVICSTQNATEYQSKLIKKLIVLNNFEEVDISKLCREVDVYFNPANGLTPKNLPKGIPVVTVIHDLQHNHYPHFFPNGEFEGRNKDYGYAICRSDGLVAISNWEKSNFQKYFNVNNVKTIYHAPYLFDNRKKYKNENTNDKNITRFSKYFIYPAVAWPHKNHYRLIEAFYLLNKKRKGDFNLVLTGTVNHISSTSLWYRKFKEVVGEDFIEILGHVSNDELLTLLTNSEGMVFPSLYEGFGIPVVDAMSFGIPVIASKLTAIPEVTQGTIEFFKNPYDSFQIADDLLDFEQKISQGKYDIEEARKVTSSYSSTRIVSELLDYFKEVIETKKSNNPSFVSYSDKNVGKNLNPRKLTIVIDLNFAKSNLKDVNEIIQNILNNSLQENIDYSFIMPYEIRETINKEIFEGMTKIASYSYYEEKVLSSKIMALEHLLEMCISTSYFIYVSLQQFLNLDYFFIRKAMASLDLFADLYSATNSPNEFHTSEIIRPPDEATAVREFDKLFGAGEIMLSHFSNRLVRTSMCKSDGMIGTIASISRDTSKYSNLII